MDSAKKTMTAETGYLIRYRNVDGGVPFYLHFNWKHEDDIRKGCVLGCHNRNVCEELFMGWLASHPDREKFLDEHTVTMMKVEVTEALVDVLNVPNARLLSLLGEKGHCTYRGALAECHDIDCPIHGPQKTGEDE